MSHINVKYYQQPPKTYSIIYRKRFHIRCPCEWRFWEISIIHFCVIFRPETNDSEYCHLRNNNERRKCVPWFNQILKCWKECVSMSHACHTNIILSTFQSNKWQYNIYMTYRLNCWTFSQAWLLFLVVIEFVIWFWRASSIYTRHFSCDKLQSNFVKSIS